MKRVIKSSTNAILDWDYYPSEKCYQATVNPDAGESELEAISILKSSDNGKYYLLLLSGSGYAEPCGGDVDRNPSLETVNDAKAFARNVVSVATDSKQSLNIYDLAKQFGPIKW